MSRSKSPVAIESLDDLFGWLSDIETSQPNGTIHQDDVHKQEEPLASESAEIPSLLASQVVESSHDDLRPAYVLAWMQQLTDDSILECGHMNCFSLKKHEVARDKGFCCEGGRRRFAVDFVRRRGIYHQPIPKQWRRSLDRERTQGWPGYCCDELGWYVGGIGNNCRFDRPEGAPMCTVHGARHLPAVVEPEIIEEDEPETELEPTQRKSFKQRQIEAKKALRKGA